MNQAGAADLQDAEDGIGEGKRLIRVGADRGGLFGRLFNS